MSYLDVARSALSYREQSEKRPPTTTSSHFLATTAGEISEGSEKNPTVNHYWLTPQEAEDLKAQIIAAVTVEPEIFDRARYEALLAQWNAYEAAMAGRAQEGQVA